MPDKRDYGIDLLRIILMFMIIIGHLLTHTNIRSILPEFGAKWIFTWAIQTITICAVDCFILISGYFGINSKYNVYKVFKLWGKVIFYSTLMTLAVLLVKNVTITPIIIINAIFPVLREEYWFITSYLLLFLFEPYINKLIKIMSDEQAKLLAFTIIIVFYIFPIFSVLFVQFDASEGMGIIGFITLYIIGAVLRKTNVSFSKRICSIMLMINCSIMFLSKIVLTVFVNAIKKDFGTALLYHYNTVFVLINAIAIMYLFKGLHFNDKNCKYISLLSNSAFAVYLIHEKPLVRELIWNNQLCNQLLDSSIIVFVAEVIGIGCAILIIGLLTDVILTKIIFSFIDKCSFTMKVRKICDKYNYIVNNKECK